MAGDVLNIKVCSPLKLHNGLTEKHHAICHYSYNLPLWASKSNHRNILNIYRKINIKKYEDINI